MNNNFNKRYVGGFVLIGLGVLFLLNQLGYASVSIGELIRTYWPVFLILAGGSQLGGKYGSSSFGGLVLIVLGFYFLGRNLDFIDVNPSEFFRFFGPAALIVGGLYVLFKPRRTRRRHQARRKERNIQPPTPPHPPQHMFHPEMTSSLDEAFSHLESRQQEPIQQEPIQQEPQTSTYSSANRQHATFDHQDMANTAGFIGDVHLGKDYFQLKPSNISHFIGDTIIDLTKAQIPYGETVIHVSAFIGDVKVFMPEDMDIGITVSSNSFVGDMKILNDKQGGFLSKVQSSTPNYNEAGRKVKLVVSIFIGDVRVNMVG
ncbi:lia operon protein LiaF [Paenibacillus shirakamiensis]|uniref:Lia operon protein LiaF n=1 Tax=Paenibacillus shirakamiensis TaxID=1265935 RepID=A0ABS4JKF5_9BACL|nr:cell wall-active antibiotics response protein LiaF [Paenibacillus shirakamiensis]MBP2002187.1 lia operon protein LiaF [Paenibacillus shirakamiensis]